jgi:alkane 1-monooxygenase
MCQLFLLWRMNTKSILFFAITLTPTPLLFMAASSGGYWVVTALIYMTLFALICDETFELDFTKAGTDSAARDLLPLVLAITHFLLLPLAVYALSTAPLGLAAKVVLFFAFGLFFGMISHANAHEMIHRTNRLHFRLGKWVFISMLFGHHTSAHLLVHHPYVATPKDPNSARMNESFYRFMKRACVAEFRAGLQAENMRLKKRGLAATGLRNPYWQYCLGALAGIVVAYAIAGLTGIFVYLALSAYAQSQMMIIDYVQHYGLQRKLLDNGKYEPVGPQHSWNAPHWFSAFMTLNAPRHSDHHASPAKPYTDLDGFRDSAPQLPHSIPYMAAVALWPRRWRAIMNPAANRWRDI